MNRPLSSRARLSPRWLVAPGLALAALAVADVAHATVERTGDWPATEPPVSLEVDGTVADGVQKLGAVAGWSVVVPRALGAGEPLRVTVREQAPGAVLDALFADAHVIADRRGNLVRFTAKTSDAGDAGAAGAASAATGLPSAPSAPPADRTLAGGRLVVEAGEVVRDVSGYGGRMEIKGEVTGNVTLTGGRVDLLPGAHVHGNVTVVGGRVDVAPGARVDGRAGVVGGRYHAAPGAIVGGKTVEGDANANAAAPPAGDNHDEPEGDAAATTPAPTMPTTPTTWGGKAAAFFHEAGEAVTRMALLYVVGVVALALGASRFERVALEVATKPARSFAVGLLGLVASGVALVALCVTVVGIPIALLVTLAAVLGFYVALASTLTVVGKALTGHRWESPYAHLLVGCALFLVASNVPFVGGFVTVAVGFVAFGALVATRAGGLLRRGGRGDASPAL